MTPKELSDKLSSMYHNAPKGETVAMIHLFGIKYAAQIQNCGESAQYIVEQSSIPNSYVTEVNKMVKLARYVIPRN